MFTRALTRRTALCGFYLQRRCSGRSGNSTALPCTAGLFAGIAQGAFLAATQRGGQGAAVEEVADHTRGTGLGGTAPISVFCVVGTGGLHLRGEAPACALLPAAAASQSRMDPPEPRARRSRKGHPDLSPSAWKSRSPRPAPAAPPQDGLNVGGAWKVPSVSAWP